MITLTIGGPTKVIFNLLQAHDNTAFNARFIDGKKAVFSFPNADAYNINMYNLKGEKVLQKSLSVSRSGDYTMPLDNFHPSSGMYLIRINSEKMHAEKKVLVSK